MPTIRQPMRITCRLIGSACALLTTMALAQTPAASSAPAKAHVTHSATTHPASLDLKAPPLNHIYPSRQLQYILAPESNEDLLDAGVSVKADKLVVNVPGGPGNQLVAIPWAILHPTQAWRIFTPLESP